MIRYKSKTEVEIMREAGRITAEAHACFAGEQFTMTTIGPLARVGAAPVPG